MINSERVMQRLANMTVRELAKLHLLNRQLQQVEHWIRQRTVQSMFNRPQAFGLKDGEQDFDSLDNVEVIASIVYLSRDSSNCNAFAGNAIAKLDAQTVLVPRDECNGRRTLSVESGPNPLANLDFCQPFIDLFYHFDGDWDCMFAIEAIKTEVTISELHYELKL
jgi:hypothetical protein